jgi:hypothetical protein
MLGYVGSVGAAWLIRKIFGRRSGVAEAERVGTLGERMGPLGVLVRLPLLRADFVYCVSSYS